MSEIETLLRALIGEVRALRETVAAAHAQSMVHREVTAGVDLSDEAVTAHVQAYFQDAMSAGRRAAAPVDPVDGKSP